MTYWISLLNDLPDDLTNDLTDSLLDDLPGRHTAVAGRAREGET